MLVMRVRTGARLEPDQGPDRVNPSAPVPVVVLAELLVVLHVEEACQAWSTGSDGASTASLAAQSSRNLSISTNHCLPVQEAPP